MHLRVPTAATATTTDPYLLIRLVRPGPGDHLSIRGLISKRHREGKAPLKSRFEHFDILPTARLLTGGITNVASRVRRESSRKAH